jgi:hypothetical protein
MFSFGELQMLVRRLFMFAIVRLRMRATRWTRESLSSRRSGSVCARRPCEDCAGRDGTDLHGRQDHRVASWAAYGRVRGRSPTFAVSRKPLCDKPFLVHARPRIWTKRTGSVGVRDSKRRGSNPLPFHLACF